MQLCSPTFNTLLYIRRLPNTADKRKKGHSFSLSPKSHSTRMSELEIFTARCPLVCDLERTLDLAAIKYASPKIALLHIHHTPACKRGVNNLRWDSLLGQWCSNVFNNILLPCGDRHPAVAPARSSVRWGVWFCAWASACKRSQVQAPEPPI